MKRTILPCVMACVSTVWLLPGCDMNTGKRVVVEPSTPAATPEPSPQPAQRIMAHVNGQPIPMDRLYDALVADDGMRVSQQLVADEIVVQELVRQKLPLEVSDQELEMENRRTLSKVFQFENAPSPEQLDGVLNQLLAQRNITRRVWDTTMARNVRLARLAQRDPRAKVTDEELRQAFFEEYDGKFKARHIQVPTAEIAQDVMEKARKGADFKQLAFQYSTNPSGKTGGELPVIGPRTAPDTVPTAIVDVIRSMKTPGQVSNIVQVGSNFHVLKLEEVVPPENVKFSEVKGKLRYIVRERNIDRLQPAILKELIDRAKIEYDDPVIRSQVKRGKNL